MNLQTMGGRRFILTMMSGLFAVLLVWFAKIDGPTYSLVTLSTVGAYITGNVVERIKAPIANQE